MSSSRVSGKLTFLVLALATALGGCVVASGTGEETAEPVAKTGEEQVSPTTESTQKGATGKGAKGTTESSNQSSGSEIEPPPIPLFQGGSQTQGTIFRHVDVVEPRPQ